MRMIARIYDGIHALLAFIVCACVVLITALVCADVFLRNMNLPTLVWQAEISEYAQYIATFLGAPWVLRLGGHVRVDVFLSMMKPARRYFVEILADVIGLIASCYLFAYGLRTVYLTWRDNQQQIKMLVVPEWWIYSVVVVSGLLLIIEFLRRLLSARTREDDSTTVQI